TSHFVPLYMLASTLQVCGVAVIVSPSLDMLRVAVRPFGPSTWPLGSSVCPFAAVFIALLLAQLACPPSSSALRLSVSAAWPFSSVGSCLLAVQARECPKFPPGS
ncbi:hypothetical protein EDC04DRAFT_2649986, partial [Pisolithus marmoratus]